MSKKTPGTRGDGKKPAHFPATPMFSGFSGDDGLMSSGAQYSEVEHSMHGYVLPIAVAVVLSTKAIFGFAHCGRASGLLGRRHGQAAQRRNSAPPTSQAAQHQTSGIHVSRRCMQPRPSCCAGGLSAAELFNSPPFQLLLDETIEMYRRVSSDPHRVSAAIEPSTIFQ